MYCRQIKHHVLQSFSISDIFHIVHKMQFSFLSYIILLQTSTCNICFQDWLCSRGSYNINWYFRFMMVITKMAESYKQFAKHPHPEVTLSLPVAPCIFTSIQLLLHPWHLRPNGQVSTLCWVWCTSIADKGTFPLKEHWTPQNTAYLWK